MLNQPINVIPSELSGVGDGVIDATQPLTVSWNVSGDTPMLAYEIVIQQNDVDSTQVYDSTKVVLADPFYGTNQYGVQQTFYANEISAAALATAGIENGYEYGYKLLITQWWGDTDDDSITQTSPSKFITRDTPTLSIDAISDPLASRILSATATYEQDQGDAIAYVRWVLADYEDQRNPILDTGEIQTQVLQFDYDGLFSGTEYILTITVQTVNGVVVSDSETFTVEYAISEDVGVVTACAYSNQPFVELKWTAMSTIEPTEPGHSEAQVSVEGDTLYITSEYASVTPDPIYSTRNDLNLLNADEYSVSSSTLNFNTGGSVTVENGVATIQSGGQLGYSGFQFDNPWSFAWRGKVGSSASTTVVSFGNSGNAFDLVIETTGANAGVTFKRGTNILFHKGLSITAADEFVVAVNPTHYYIEHFTFTGGTLPSDTLYPSNTLYPSDATPVTNTYDADYTAYTQVPITSITLNGYQECEYVWLISGSFSSFDITNLIGSSWYEPVYDSKTYFLLDFANDDKLAVISGGNGNLLGSAIYRREAGASLLTKITDISASEGETTYTILRDYGAKSQTEYQYYVFELGATTYATTFGSVSIKPMFNQYCLMECVYSEEDGAYHVQKAYPFSCNLNHGAVSNNNTPNILQNFTRVPTRQPVTANYDSGTLTALIGSVNQNTLSYEDSWELAQSIKQMSVSTNPKFLRGMKGELWRVETSAAIATQIVGKSAVMPIQIAIPWVEIGEADDVPIIALPSDAVFPSDQIGETTVTVDLTTGELYWTIPNGCSGTMLSISDGFLAEMLPESVAPAELEINSKGYLTATQES